MGLPPHSSPREGLARLCSCPRPFFPLGSDPREKREGPGLVVATPSRCPALLWEGDKATRVQPDLPARNTVLGQQEAREEVAALEYSSTASLTSSSLAAAF